MTFLNYLNTNRNLIIKFYIINLLALFVNLFHIEGKFLTDGCNENYPTENALFTKEIVTIYEQPFNEDVSGYSSGEMEIYSKGKFYPFVPFFKHNILNGKSYCSNSFYGIFAFYDYSEFIAYSLLLLLILYFKWDKKNRVKTNVE